MSKVGCALWPLTNFFGTHIYRRQSEDEELAKITKKDVKNYSIKRDLSAFLPVFYHLSIFILAPVWLPVIYIPKIVLNIITKNINSKTKSTILIHMSSAQIRMKNYKYSFSLPTSSLIPDQVHSDIVISSNEECNKGHVIRTVANILIIPIFMLLSSVIVVFISASISMVSIIGLSIVSVSMVGDNVFKMIYTIVDYCLGGLVYEVVDPMTNLIP